MLERINPYKTVDLNLYDQLPSHKFLVKMLEQPIGMLEKWIGYYEINDLRILMTYREG